MHLCKCSIPEYKINKQVIFSLNNIIYYVLTNLVNSKKQKKKQNVYIFVNKANNVFILNTRSRLITNF